jgi:hypothetical protein
MGSKTNSIGFRLGSRKAWLDSSYLSSYPEQTRQVFYTRRLAESMVKRLRLQPVKNLVKSKSTFLAVQAHMAKKRLKRRGGTLTIRRLNRLRWRRWRRLGARVFDKIRPLEWQQRGYTARKLSVRKLWSIIRSRKLRRFWRLVICSRLKRQKRRLFWKHLQFYLLRQAQKNGIDTQFTFFILRNPVISAIRRLKIFYPRRAHVLAVWSKTFSRFSTDLYFSRKFQKMVDDVKRIKWNSHVLRNIPRYVSAAMSAFWLPSAKILCVIVCHALKVHRKHWPVIKFIERLIERLAPINMCIRGIRLEISGKFNRRLRATKMVFTYGSPIQLNTLDTLCDFYFSESYSYLGVFGVKVWFYLSNVRHVDS